MAEHRTTRQPVGGDNRNPLGPKQDLTLSPQAAGDGIYGKRTDFGKADAARTAISTLDDHAEIEVADDGTMRFGGITVTKSGLIVDVGATVDDWLKVGYMLRQMHTSIQFLLGDWITAGAKICGGDLKELIQKIGYTERSLEQFKYVANAVPSSIRIETLKFGHHALVAPMKDRGEQKKWLKKAVDGKWAIAKMRQEILKASDVIATPLSTSETAHDSAVKFTAGLKAMVRQQSKQWGSGQRLQLATMLHEILRELEG